MTNKLIEYNVYCKQIKNNEFTLFENGVLRNNLYYCIIYL